MPFRPRPRVAELVGGLPSAPPAAADPSSCTDPATDKPRTPFDPGARVPRFEPQPAGTLSHYCLFYGPYLMPGGQVAPAS